MPQAVNSPTTTHDCAATPSEISEMIEALDAADPKPPLTDYAAWVAEGIEAAAETREFERRRASLMAHIYGDDTVTLRDLHRSAGARRRRA